MTLLNNGRVLEEIKEKINKILETENKKQQTKKYRS